MCGAFEHRGPAIPVSACFCGASGVHEPLPSRTLRETRTPQSPLQHMPAESSGGLPLTPFQGPDDKLEDLGIRQALGFAALIGIKIALGTCGGSQTPRGVVPKTPGRRPTPRGSEGLKRDPEASDGIQGSPQGPDTGSLTTRVSQPWNRRSSHVRGV